MKKTEETRTQSGLSGKPEDYHDIYDRIAKRCLSLSPRCTVSLINGLFGTDYPADSRVNYNWTENLADGLRRTLADTIVTIGGHSYHCEFQMTVDGGIVLRVLEYGLHHALRNEGGREVLAFPDPMIVYLYDEPIPDEYTVRIRFGTHTEVEYRVPVYKYLDRSRRSEAERDQLIALLPFQLLRCRKVFETDKGCGVRKENADVLRRVIVDDIIEVLKRNERAGKLTASEKNEIVKAVKLLYNHIYGRYDQEMPEVKKLVDDALVLDGDEYTREIWDLRDELQETKDELQEKENKLQETKGELQEKENKLQETEGELQQKEDELQEKDRQISELKRQLALLQKK